MRVEHQWRGLEIPDHSPDATSILLWMWWSCGSQSSQPYFAVRLSATPRVSLIFGDCLRLIMLALLPLIALMICSPLQAAITVTRAELTNVETNSPAISDATQESGSRFLLNADAEIEINQTIERGLASGVPLFFDARLEIHKLNPWWFDHRVHDSVTRFSLAYYELTRHYRVTLEALGRARNFRSLLDALDYIGSLRDLPVVTETGIDEGEAYQARLQLVLDQNSLPLALRPVAFVSSAWRLRSEAFQWLID